MKIGIISAGNIGRVLASLGVKAGHEIMLSNSRGPETLVDTVSSIGCKAGTLQEAAEFGDGVSVVTIPLGVYKSVPAEFLAGKTVIDTMNYYPERDGQIPELDNGSTTTSELVAKHLSRSNVVKAFNSIYAKDLETDGRPPGTPNRRALPIAGDDPEAKKLVTELLDRFGYDTVDAGALAEGRRFERDTPTYCKVFDAVHLKEALASM
jgi:8-hydroxy-5-deazaflavin:NADPH oxidoreductase